MKSNFAELQRLSEQSPVLVLKTAHTEYHAEHPQTTADASQMNSTTTDRFQTSRSTSDVPITESRDISSFVIGEHVDSPQITKEREQSLIHVAYLNMASVFDPQRSVSKPDTPSPAVALSSAYETWRVSHGLDSLASFLTEPVAKESPVVKCSIVRVRGFLGTTYYPTYNFGTDPKQGTNISTTFMTTKKETGANSFYRINMVGKSDNLELGSVRSNFMGSEYLIQKKTMGEGKSQSYIDTAAIRYSSAFQRAGGTGPRELVVLLPPYNQFRPLNLSELAKQVVEDQKDIEAESGVTVCVNRKPRWEPKISGYVLNFTQRVTGASVKNFQLIKATGLESEDTVLQFGKVSKDVFTLDFKHPFSPLQAFGIALSSFDFKFCCD